MKNQSLFGHILASKLSGQAENLATESLLYVMDSSTVAKKAVLRFLNEGHPELLDEIRFSSQQLCEGGCIPDLVGTDSESKKRIIIEAKFWANLTVNQPVAYLAQFELSGILLFIAPGRRLGTLSAELVRRCKDANLNVSSETSIESEVSFRTINDHHTLMIASWRAVLDRIASSLRLEEDPRTLADVSQFHGLCVRMDEEAFLPLRSEELGGDLARRILQCHRIVDDVVTKLSAEALISPSGRASESGGTYWRPMRISGCHCYLQVSLSLWANQRMTPISPSRSTRMSCRSRYRDRSEQPKRNKRPF